MLSPECIPDDVLQSLTVGDLSEEKAASWEEHLLQCPDCLARTRSIGKADTLVDALRASRHLQESADEISAVEALEQRIVETSREDVMSSAPTAASEVDQPTFLSSPSPVTAAPTVHITGTAAIVPGNLFGPYRILKKLGEGGMGAVYQAMHTRLDKVVALKVLPSQVTRHQAAVARFEREMRAVGKLEHPHIVRAMDAGEIDGTHYLAMEYVEGTDLAQLVKNRGPLSVVNGCKAIRQAALALAAAHAAGLVHRDLKPANLLVGKNGQIKLLDLGLARLADDTAESSELTSAGQAFGTPDFMAPEQWEDAHTTDARADLYALGCTLYYVLTGRPPYGGDRYKTTVAKFRGHVNDPIPGLAEARPDVPAAVVDIYQKLMAKSPADRYQTAAEVVAALQPFTSSKVANPELPGTPGTGLALSTGMVTSAELSPSVSRLTKQASASSGRGGRRPRTLVMAGAGGLLLLAAGIIVTITSKDGTKSTFNVPEGIELDVDSAPGSRVAIKEVASPASSDTQLTALASQSSWHGWPADAPKPAIAPFDAAQAKRHQEEWAAYLKVPVEYTNSIGMKLRLIPPGEFTMGSTPEEIAAALKDVGDYKPLQEYIQSEAPQHKVILTQPIYLGVNEVTQAEYEKVMGVNPSHFAPMGMGKVAVAGQETADHPVETVSWNDAAEFCAMLSQQEKLKPFYFRAGETITALDGTGYRLPSEAEWEYACRAGTVTKYWIGDQNEDLVRAGWFIGNAGGRTHAVSELNANPFGRADIHGNLWEWVQDGWDASYYGQFSEKPAINPNSLFSAGSKRVFRGGDWRLAASGCRSSSRYVGGPTDRGVYIGFRVSLTVDAVRQSASNAASRSTSTTTLKTVGWHGWPVDAPPPAIAPFNVDEAKAHQVAWAKYLDVPVEYENSIGMKFRLIPPGEFLMGSTPDEIEATLDQIRKEDSAWRDRAKSEGPQHVVRLTQPIYLGTTEVTQSQYESVVGKNPSHFSKTGAGRKVVAGLDTRSHPVETVSWYEVLEFCSKLGQLEGLKGPLPHRTDSSGQPSTGAYGLPTEAEWEFACRAGTTSSHWTGNDTVSLGGGARFGDEVELRTYPVGQLAANPFGLFDTHGNVWEWVRDGWEQNYYARLTDQPIVDPLGVQPPGGMRVQRGGASRLHAMHCRSANRGSVPPDMRLNGWGFRVALSVEAVRRHLSETPEMKSLQFDGSTARVEIPTLVMDTSKPITIEVWTRPSRPVTHGVVAGFAGQCVLRLRGRQWWFGIRETDSKIREVVASSDADWTKATHVAGVYDGSHLRLFVDGIRHGDPVACSSVVAVNWMATIGATFDGKDSYAGEISQARVSQIARYVDDFDPPVSFGIDDFTVAVYRFDDGQGAVLTDATANKHHGKIVGAKWVSLTPSPANATAIPSVPPTWTLRSMSEWAIQRGGQVLLGDGRVIARLEDLPGEVTRVDQITFTHVKSFGDAEAAIVGSWPKLKGIAIGDTSITDAGLRKLAELPLGNILSVPTNAITGAGFDAFAEKSLGTVVVAYCRLSPAGWKFLAKVGATNQWLCQRANLTDDALAEIVAHHPEITKLDVQGTELTDASAEHLARLKNLRELSLQETGIADSGLEKLAALQSLTSLTLQQTKVTAAGVARLQQALPNCQIRWK